MIRNSVGERIQSYDEELFLLEVNSTGHVLYWPTREIVTECDIDASYYPFDIQDCNIRVGKWFSNDKAVNIYPGSPNIIMMYYTESEEWEVIGNKVIQKTSIENNSTFSNIVFSISLKRRPLFYIVNIILPVFFLSLLSNICFLIPIESGEKIGMCMAIFLTFAVFSTLTNESLPQSSTRMPLYGIYLLVQIFLSALTIVLEVLIIHVYQIRPENNDAKKGNILRCLMSICGTNKYVSKDESFLNNSKQDEVLPQKCNLTYACNNGIQANDTVSDDMNRSSFDHISKKDIEKCGNLQTYCMHIAIELDKFFDKFMFIVNVISFLVFMVTVTTNH